MWTRLLSLSFGVTIYAISVVLATFMAGLALGSFAAGRMADSTRRPLVTYAVLELAIGALGLASLAALQAVSPVYVWLYGATGDSLPLASLARLLLTSLVLLLPTIAMGATFPFIVRASLNFLPHLGTNLSLLYALNTAGAALGTLSAGFMLVGNIGFTGSIIVAAVLNLAAGVLALILARIVGEGSDTSGRAAPEEAERVEPEGRNLSGVVLFTMGASGFCALAYEVIWFRLLDLLLNGTAYAFSIMLGVFLVGLAAGSFLIQPFIRFKWNWVVVLGVLELCIALHAAYSVFALEQVPVARDLLTNSNVLGPFSGRPVAVMVVLCAIILFPLTVLLGMAFPVAGQALARWRPDAGAVIGSLNASNTLGAILGSLVGGLWLLPALGTQDGILWLSKLNGVLAIALLLLAMRVRARAFVVAGVAALLLLNPMLSSHRMMEGVLKNLFKGNELLWYEEGLENTVSIQKTPTNLTYLYLNNREQASDSRGMVDYHRLIGQLGLLLHPDPTETLVIGLGGGATATALSELATNRVDAVELSPSVVRAAERLTSINEDVLKRPNVHMIVDDGRNYMLLGDKKYDIITADVIQPIYAGSGNLYSREYFELAKATLDEQGIMVQWVNAGLTQIHPLIVRTFHNTFPYVTMWYKDSLLVGSKQPMDISAPAIQRLLDRPGVRDIARGMSITRADDLLKNYSGTTADFLNKAGPGPVLTDDKPLTEYFRSAPETSALALPVR